MDQILARAVFLPRLSTTLLALFALAALLLAGLGIYGVLSYSVRSARGRSACAWRSARAAADTVALVVRNSVPCWSRSAASSGWSRRRSLARSMAGILYGVGPFDLPAFSLAAGALGAAGLIARLFPPCAPRASIRWWRCASPEIQFLDYPITQLLGSRNMSSNTR